MTEKPALSQRLAEFAIVAGSKLPSQFTRRQCLALGMLLHTDDPKFRLILAAGLIAVPALGSDIAGALIIGEEAWRFGRRMVSRHSGAARSAARQEAWTTIRAVYHEARDGAYVVPAKTRDSAPSGEAEKRRVADYSVAPSKVTWPIFRPALASSLP